MIDSARVRRLAEQLYIHTAALPWKDRGFTRSEAAKQAAQDQIVDYVVNEIIKLSKEKNNVS